MSPNSEKSRMNMHETDERATVRVLISQPLSVFKTLFLKNDFSLMVLVLVLLLLQKHPLFWNCLWIQFALDSDVLQSRHISLLLTCLP